MLGGQILIRQSALSSHTLSSCEGSDSTSMIQILLVVFCLPLASRLRLARLARSSRFLTRLRQSRFGL